MCPADYEGYVFGLQLKNRNFSRPRINGDPPGVFIIIQGAPVIVKGVYLANADLVGGVERTREYDSNECFEVQVMLFIADTHCCGTLAEDELRAVGRYFARENWGKGGEGVEFERAGPEVEVLVADEDGERIAGCWGGYAETFYPAKGMGDEWGLSLSAEEERPGGSVGADGTCAHDDDSGRREDDLEVATVLCITSIEVDARAGLPVVDHHLGDSFAEGYDATSEGNWEEVHVHGIDFVQDSIVV